MVGEFCPSRGAVVSSAPAFPPAGYILASAFLEAFPLPVRSAYAEQLRQLEPLPQQLRAARAALTSAGFLLPCGELTAEGREAARNALGLLA